MSRPLEAHEERWIVTAIQLDRSRLSERALLNRSLRNGPGCRINLRVTFVAQTWYLAREIAAIFFGLNIDAIEVAHDTAPMTTMIPLDVRREHGDLVVAVPGFFDVENEPPEDEYAPVPVSCDWMDGRGSDCDGPVTMIVLGVNRTQYCQRHYERGVEAGLWP